MKKRIFIAINFDTSFLKKDLDDIKRELENEPIKWVELKNIHLTLLFIGSVPFKKMGLIEYTVEKNIKNLSPSKMKLISLGGFSRVIWIGAEIENQKNLEEFQEKLKDELQENFPIKKQRFVPHITIGRIKGRVDRKKISKVIERYKNHNFGSTYIDSVDIMESELTREGPIYKIIRKFDL